MSESDIKALALTLTDQWQTAHSLGVECCLRVSEVVKGCDVLVTRGAAERHPTRDWYRLPI